MSIQAVLLDFGGVFTESPFAVFEDAALELGAAPADVIDIVFGPYDRDTNHPWHRLERGEIPLPDARHAIMDLATERGLTLEPLKILARMATGGGARDLVVERTRRLRAAGVKTALVTNNVVEFRDGWRSLIPVDELFDVVVDSSEVGIRKPDPAIFELALERVGRVDPTRAAFLDDFQGNIDAATRLGIHSILVPADPAPALAELDRLLAR